MKKIILLFLVLSMPVLAQISPINDSLTSTRHWTKTNTAFTFAQRTSLIQLWVEVVQDSLTSTGADTLAVLGVAKGDLGNQTFKYDIYDPTGNDIDSVFIINKPVDHFYIWAPKASQIQFVRTDSTMVGKGRLSINVSHFPQP